MREHNFPYSDLAIDDNEIRLISVAPGEYDDPIFCHMFHVNMRLSNDYTALSYTWGKKAASEVIHINNQYQFHVTPNLKDALLHLRQKSVTRMFWIDAICINQENVLERNKHIPRMRDVYAQASCVEVWLGKANDIDYHALTLVQQVGRIICDPEVFLSMGGMIEHKEHFNMIFENATPELVKTLNEIYQKPWWSRVWVVQELSVADQEKARVTYGNASVSWLDILITAYAIEGCWGLVNDKLWQNFPNIALDGFNNGIRMAQCRDTRKSWPRHHLLELLHQHRDCVATDPKDHVYGLLALSGDAFELGLTPDYNQSVQDVYIDLVKKHICSTKSLDIICACRGERNLTNLPSWAPDWSSDQVVPGICINERFCGGDVFPGSPSGHVEKYKASDAAYAVVTFPPLTSELVTKGFMVGKITALSSVDGGLTFEDVESFGRSGSDGKSNSKSETFNDWLNLILDDENYKVVEQRYGEMVLEAFSRTLVADRNNRMMRPSLENELDLISNSSDCDVDPITNCDENTGENHAKSPGSFSEQSCQSEDDTSDVFSPMHTLNMSAEEFKACIQVSWGKRLAVLDTGYLGIVPNYCVIGDFASVLLGCTLPVMLRKVEVNDNQFSFEPVKYSFVGESYFYGIAEGELMQEIRDSSESTMQTLKLI